MQMRLSNIMMILVFFLTFLFLFFSKDNFCIYIFLFVADCLSKTVHTKEMHKSYGFNYEKICNYISIFFETRASFMIHKRTIRRNRVLSSSKYLQLVERNRTKKINITSSTPICISYLTLKSMSYIIS